MLWADPECGAKSRLAVLHQTVQKKNRLVKGFQEGVLVIAKDLISVLIQQIDPGDPLILGEHIGQYVLLQPLLLPTHIVCVELIQKPGSLGQNLHVPDLL